MKKIISIIMFGMLSFLLFACGNSAEANNSSKTLNIKKQLDAAKCVTEYDKNATVDQFDTVVFGNYYISNSTSKEPIEWIVLEKDNNEALLLAKYVLDGQLYHSDDKNLTWKISTLRKWLNEDFYNIAFNDNEKEKIIDSNVINKYNGNISGDNNTIDKVYLLSIDECKKYFGVIIGNKRLATKLTDFAKYTAECDDRLFWLRSTDRKQGCADEVWIQDGVGDIGGLGSLPNIIKAGVRPLIRIRYD